MDMQEFYNKQASLVNEISDEIYNTLSKLEGMPLQVVLGMFDIIKLRLIEAADNARTEQEAMDALMASIMPDKASMQ